MAERIVSLGPAPGVGRPSAAREGCTVGAMIPVAPHVHPLHRGHQVVVALAVAAQAFALALVSPWLQPSWCVALAVAVGVSALPALRTREVLAALAARFALTLGALGVAGAAIAVAYSFGWTESLYPRANPALNLAAAGFWLWALHAPLTMSRWWVATRPAQDGALEVLEPSGVSLLATAVALTAQNPALAWSTARGTAYSTGLCAALGVGLLGWSWWAQARRRAWMRRVVAGVDPTWEMVDADDSATAEPWTHASEGDGAPRMLRLRGEGEHYRAAGVRVPVARVGARDERAWWVRRGLHVVALLWACSLVHWGAWKLLHFWPEDRWGAVVAALAAVRVDSYDEGVVAAPELRSPVACERGRWCSLSWAEPTVSGEDAQVHAVLLCQLQNSGWFQCQEGGERHSGRVRPAAAQALIEATERFAAVQRVLPVNGFPALFVTLGGSERSYAMAFPRSHEIGRALRHRLWRSY